MLIPYKDILQRYSIRPTGVLHIGANTGQEAPDYYSNGVERTIWVEANPSLISGLIANLQHYPEHRVFNDCLTEVDGEELILHISNNEGQSSSILELDYHKVAHPEVHYVEDIQMRTTRLDTLMSSNELDIEQYPFVNIDVQGAELSVLKGFGDLLHKVQYLYLEVNEKPLYTNCPLISDIEEYISTFGFVRKELKMTTFGWGDCLYIKE